MTQTEILVWSVLGLLYLVALLIFIAYLIRGDPRPIWQSFRVGVFVERLPKDEKRKEVE